MEAAVLTPARERSVFLIAGSYCAVDLAFHYFGRIEAVSSALRIPSIWFFFTAEVAFVLSGVAVVRALWKVRRPTTLGRGIPQTTLLIGTMLFVAFNSLFALVGFLIKFSGGS
jgi:hypothetical protein